MLNHVHILQQRNRFCLRAGLFKSFVGWQTAKAAKLKVGPEWNCLDNLTRAKAEELAPQLDAWIESQQTDRDRRMSGKIGVRKAEWMKLEEKYRQAMGEKDQA